MDEQPGQTSTLRSDLTARWMAVLGLLFGSLRVLLDSLFYPALLRDGQYAFALFIPAVFGIVFGFAAGNAVQLQHQNRLRDARRTLVLTGLLAFAVVTLPALLLSALLVREEGWKSVSELLWYCGELPLTGSFALLLWGITATWRAHSLARQ